MTRLKSLTKMSMESRWYIQAKFEAQLCSTFNISMQCSIACPVGSRSFP